MKPILVLLFTLYAATAYTQVNPDTLSARKDTLPAKTRQLSEVTVAGHKPVIEQRADRTVFNVENSVGTAGADGLEVLKKAPGVIVTNSNIALAGRSTVGVMLNGRLQELSMDELQGLLKSIPAENIARIEVITTPPARYDAEGNAGLINIITKKNNRAGMNGNITGAYELTRYGTYSGNGSINYRNGKWNVYANGSGMHGHIHPVYKFQSYYPGQTLEQVDNDLVLNDFGRYQLGADYNITPRHLLGVQYTIGYGSPSQDESTWQHVYNTGHGLDSSLFTHTHTYVNGLRHVMNFNYEWKIDTAGRKLLVDGDFFNRGGDRRGDIQTQRFTGPGSAFAGSSYLQNGGTQQVHVSAVKADVEWPSRMVNFTFGGKVSFINNTSDNLFTVWDGVQYVKDPNQSNVFDYTENTQALYLSGNRTVKQWELQAGLRGEYTETKGVSRTTAQVNHNQYLKLFPTLYVKYRKNEKNAFTINYSRRIERPGFWQMNPFRMYITPTSYTEGNPFLQPSFSHKGEVSWLWNDVFTASVFVQEYQHTFAQASNVDTATTSVQYRQENLGNRLQYGFRTNVNFTAGHWWESSLECDGFNSRFTSGLYKGVSTAYNKFTMYLETTNSFFLNSNKSLILSLDGWLTTASQEDFNLQQTIWSMSSGIKWITLKKKLTLAANVSDIFASERVKTINLYNASRQDLWEDTRQLRLSCTWKFGRNQKPPRTRTRMEEDAR